MIPILGSFLRKKSPPDNVPGDIQWIAGLPRDNPLAALNITLQKLAEIITVEMQPEEWRLAALLQIDAGCRGHVHALERQFIGVQKLRPELDARMWDAVYAWYRYLARGYQIFLNAHVRHPDQSDFRHELFPLIVARALHNQANIARWRYMHYQGMPDGGWLTFHQLYVMAEREGFCAKTLKLYQDMPEITLDERYIEALMLDTLNLSNLTKVQIQQISDWLNIWLAAARISREFDDRKHLFFVEHLEDRAGRRVRNFRPTPTCRYWETDRLTSSIERARKLLEQGKSLSDIGLPVNIRQDECIGLFNQLLAEWSRTDYQRQRRGEDRTRITSTATIANGLGNVWQQIKDVTMSAKRRTYVPIQGKTLDERLASHSVAAKNSGPTIAFAGATGERWIISDESTSGLGALVNSDCSEWVKLGRIVALVTEDNREQVAVGVIRSIKQKANNQRHVGIEIFTRNASNIQLTDRKSTPGPRATGDIFIDSTLINPGLVNLQGILVPANTSRGIGPSLLLPVAEFDPTGLYEVTSGMEPQILRLGQKVEQKDDWVRVLLDESGRD